MTDLFEELARGLALTLVWPLVAAKNRIKSRDSWVFVWWALAWMVQSLWVVVGMSAISLEAVRSFVLGTRMVSPNFLEVTVGISMVFVTIILCVSTAFFLICVIMEGFDDLTKDE